MDTQLHQHITTISNGGGSAVGGRVIGGNGVVSLQRDDEYRERMLRIRRLRDSNSYSCQTPKCMRSLRFVLVAFSTAA